MIINACTIVAANREGSDRRLTEVGPRGITAGITRRTETHHRRCVDVRVNTPGTVCALPAVRDNR